MEIFRVNTCTEEGIELSSLADMVKLVKCIDEEENICIEWVDGVTRKSQFLVTEGLQSKLKDGTFMLTSEESV